MNKAQAKLHDLMRQDADDKADAEFRALPRKERRRQFRAAGLHRGHRGPGGGPRPAGSEQ